MGERDRRDIRALVLRFGLAVSVSFAGFLASRVAVNRIHMAKSPPPRADVGAREAICRDDLHAMKRTTASDSIGLEGQDGVCRLNFSPSCRLTQDKDGYILPQFNHLVNDFGFCSANTSASPNRDLMMLREDVDTPKAFTSVDDEVDEEDDNYHEIEISHLKNKVRLLEERERNLELQLLELYGLKEQQTAVMELQNRVKINNMETKLLTLKIETLQAENQKLQAQASHHMKTVSDLDAARTKIKLLKKKLRSQTEQNKEQILILKKKVSKLQEQEIANDSGEQQQLQRLKDLEAQAEELKKSNSKLREENSDMAHRLEATQVLANSVLENPEMEELRQHSNRLSEENMHLTKEAERMKADRCSDVEELVYLRWINACLRYELRNFQAPNGKAAARDLSKSLSPESEEKAKKLILQYANAEGMGEKGMMRLADLETDQWLSSQASYITESTNFDDSSSVSSSKPPNSPRKLKMFRKLRRLIRGKDDHRSSPMEKGVGMEDTDYPSSVSTGTDAGSDTQSNRGQTPLSSYRYSIDSHRMIIPGMYDAVKDIDSLRVTSDLGSSDLLKRFSSGRDFTPESHPSGGQYPTGKSDLVRFAGVLKDSSDNITTELYHRKGKSSAF
ncbi:Protein CHUP1, chloroplastic [Linum perenne]